MATTTMQINDLRTRRKVPLRHSLLFNKAKHSKDWHQSIDSVAGVLHPSDSKFPYHLLRQATDAYIKKKGKITQADADIRLAILIDGHETRDFAVAATAHAITATSLRAILHVDLNVAHGSYWGLETWLQCLIAANYGNPAAVTDLEATWARNLLPFAQHGPGAAGKLLVGISRVLRECATPSMNMVPEFLNLISRALTDYAAHLEGLRLKNDWIASYGASCWMTGLGGSTPASTPPGSLFPEHILDARFPVWRVWANWRPDLRLVRVLGSIEGNSTAVLSDLLALEGPDIIRGTKHTLREGLVEQYSSDRGFVKLGTLLIEVPGRTKDGLREILESAISTLGSIWTAAASKDRPQLFRLFTELTIARPMTQEALNLVQAALFISGSAQVGFDSDFTDAVLCIYTAKYDLGGDHVQELQTLIHLFDQDCASGIRRILSTPALFQGINKCIYECQAAIRMLIEQGQPWTELALEFHTFCSVLKTSKYIPIVGEKVIEQMCVLLPSKEQLSMAFDIYSAARAQRSVPYQSSATDRMTDKGSLLGRPEERVSAPSFPAGEDRPMERSLEEVVEQFFLHRLLSQQVASYTSQRTFDAILSVWEDDSASKLTRDRRLLAILVARITADDEDLRIRCLNGIASTEEQLSPGLPLHALWAILQATDKSSKERIVKLIRLLAGCSSGQDFKAQLLCWRDLTYHLLTRKSRHGVFEEADLAEHALSTMEAAEWIAFLEDAHSVFASGPALPSDENDVPSILQSELQRCRAEIAPYTDTLTRLETALGHQSEPVRCMLSRDGVRISTVVGILQTLWSGEGKPIETFLQKVVGLLSSKATNGCDILDCIVALSGASLDTVDACMRIWDAKHGFLLIPGLPQGLIASTQDRSKSPIPTHSTTGDIATINISRKNTPIDPAAHKFNVPTAVVYVMVAGWLQDDDASKGTKDAIHSIAGLLGILPMYSDVSKALLIKAATFWQKIEDDIIQEEACLAALRKALKAKDPKGTALLLEQIGVPDTTELDEEMMKLPAGVMDSVERIGDSEVAMTFSLAALTQLQRAAMGIPEGAHALMLQLSLEYNNESLPSFCLHYNTDPHSETLAHTRYVCSAESENPTKQICTSAQTALTWQLSRVIFSEIRRGTTGIADIFQHINTWLPKLAQLCVSCSARNAQPIQLRRSTPCTSNPYACAQLWYNLPLHVRVPEIRADIFAVDMALTSVYAAAVANMPELLPNCPIRGTEIIKFILNALPSMRVMRDAVNLSAVLATYHPQAEKLISWAVVQHRGFLATATGLLKIPNLPPGTHQFVLANASPKLEHAFAHRIKHSDGDTTVLFHGTRIDRLPAILAQGLRVCSGTALQRTGAAHGKGIYLSDDPETSFYYSAAGLSWKNSGLSNMRMVLGCEVVGTASRILGNIHVVADPASVMVRYVFLFANGNVRVPIRGHVQPAMASAMKAVRSGAV
ncbi:uncharacterized protein M421DRAFT_422441 [Didymella exigua CBS 183.55]|uniref:PARP catalytic domain-containing protein n=1 Tax=Didymella exigua CBS 183.55 TaxID=1150837 RepID=A0A6A5REY7_9PLEO|nr:uncharacterized protein M421DRAFT_422441 [Didymella exigua CBS 183.55]KAF1926835.1 hypothetical protein M421DRAFT_422441 [Didymella exigua CBS 183.55]